jgi:hypothetical protein
MRKTLLILFFPIGSCMVPRMTPALREAFPKVVPKDDTVCLWEEYDWIKSDEAIHIHCRHDAANKPLNHRK